MTMLPHLTANLSAMRSLGQPAAQWLDRFDIDRDLLNERIFKNEWGLIDYRMDSGKGLFESLRPGALYTNWIPEQKAHTSATFVVGCNVGYGLNHVLMNTPDSHKVILVEPDPRMLMACLGQTDYTPMFTNKKLYIAPPDEDHLFHIAQNLDLQFIYGSIHLRSDVPSRQLGAEYAQWTGRVQARLENFTVEMTTLRHRQDVMVGNELQNFRRAMDQGSLMPMKNSAQGLSAVILGAGPSLAQSGPLLAENPGYALYATSLQSIPALQEVGIKPHVCLAIDFNEHMLRLFKRLDMNMAKDVPLIYSTKVNPKVVDLYPGPVIPLWTLGGMATFVLQGNELVLDAGGNVSLTLARLLRWCGVSRLTLVGQDFAWKGDRTHCDGHHAHGDLQGFDPIRHRKLTNLDGEEIITSAQYLASKRELEDDISRSDLPVFNLYGGGADIKGTTPVTFGKACRKGCLASMPGTVEGFLDTLGNCRKSGKKISFAPQGPTWGTNLRRAEKRLEKLFKKVGKNQTEIHEVFSHVALFMKQDPLYLPYLYNETIDLAGLTRAKARYDRADLSAFKKLMRRMLGKVREVDRCLAGAPVSNIKNVKKKNAA